MATNMKSGALYSISLIFITVFLSARGSAKKDSESKQMAYYAVAELRPTAGSKTKGRIWFSEAFGSIKVEGEVTGLDKNSKHGIHIHEFGDCTASDGTSAGGHFNPEGHDHASPDH